MPLTLNALAELSGLASEHVLREEEEETGLSREVILSKMRERLAVMRDSIQRGLASDAPSVAGMVGKNAKTLWEAPDPLRDPLLKRVQAYAMAKAGGRGPEAQRPLAFLPLGDGHPP
jgi:L-serine dehydratase